jgi:cyanophycinase
MILSTLVLYLAAGLPAFPGAEGFGADTPGGRGGRVLFVDSLADSGPGTLRAALEAKGPRFVVFRTGGWITLEKRLTIREPYVTVLGQSAPGGGIGLRGRTLEVATHDVILRHLRCRLGESAGVAEDAVSVSSGARRVVLDHISASWSVDETLSVSGDVADVTVQYSLIAESLRESVHAKGKHGYGTLLRAVGGVSFHHNVWAHHDGRNPRLGDNYGQGAVPTFDIRHNLIYNWGSYATGLVEGRMRVNYVGNRLVAGRDSNPKREAIYLKDGGSEATEFYLAGNTRPGWQGDWFTRGAKTLRSEAFPAPNVRSTPLTLRDTGATRPRRDAADERILRGIREGAGTLVDHPGEWPELAAGTFPPDADGDGLPDEAEPREAAALAPSGYTWLEEYWNREPVAVGPEKGSLLVIGGGAVGAEIWREFARLAGGFDAPVVYIPTAGDAEPKPGAEAFLRRAGFTDVTVLHTRDRSLADSAAFAEPLARAKAVFFGGGRQWRLVDSYADTRTEAALAAVLARGGVIAGTSAGATIQGSYLVRGARENNFIMMAPGYEKGFGYLRGVAIDQHLLKRQRQDDLWPVLKKHPELLGIGIDESTAISVEGDRFRVVGASLVGIYDPEAGPHYFLTPGMSFDLRARKPLE